MTETTQHESAPVMNDLTLMPLNEEVVSECITAYCFAFLYSFKLLNIYLFKEVHAHSCNNHVESTKLWWFDLG